LRQLVFCVDGEDQREALVLPPLAVKPPRPVAGGGAGGGDHIAGLQRVSALVGDPHLGDRLTVGF